MLTIKLMQVTTNVELNHNYFAVCMYYIISNIKLLFLLTIVNAVLYIVHCTGYHLHIGLIVNFIMVYLVQLLFISKPDMTKTPSLTGV